MIAAAIPLKSLRVAKSRLNGHVPEELRVELVKGLARRTVAALRRSGAVDRIALVTAERSLAAEWSVEWLPDRGGLNRSLLGAVGWARLIGASRLLIVPADLPWLEPADITALVNEAGAGPSVGLAPARDGGTGALLLTPPDVIQPAFGPASFRRHHELAERRRVEVFTVVREGFSLDLDRPEDLQEWGEGVRDKDAAEP